MTCKNDIKKKRQDKSSNITMKSTGVRFRLFQPDPHCSEHIQYKTAQRLSTSAVLIHFAGEDLQAGRRESLLSGQESRPGRATRGRSSSSVQLSSTDQASIRAIEDLY